MNETEIEQEERPKEIWTKKRRLVFVYVPLLIIACFVVSLIFGEPTPRYLDLIFAIGLNVSAFAWCRLDSRERGYELHRLFPYAIVIFGIVALAYYLFRSRGIWGGFAAIGWFFLYAVVTFIGSGILVLIVCIILVLIGILPPSVFDT